MKTRVTRILLLMSLIILLLGLCGCEKDAKLKIFNRTHHLLYASVNQQNAVIPALSNYSFKVETRSTNIMEPDVEKGVRLYLQGETFSIIDEDDSVHTSTIVKLHAGETTTVYADANRAGVKVINHSGQTINQIVIARHNPDAFVYYTTYNVDLPNNGEWYTPIAPSTTANPFYLTVSLTYANNVIQPQTYGGTTSVYGVDDLFLITTVPPINK